MNYTQIYTVGIENTQRKHRSYSCYLYSYAMHSSKYTQQKHVMCVHTFIRSIFLFSGLNSQLSCISPIKTMIFQPTGFFSLFQYGLTVKLCKYNHFGMLQRFTLVLTKLENLANDCSFSKHRFQGSSCCTLDSTVAVLAYLS